MKKVLILAVCLVTMFQVAHAQEEFFKNYTFTYADSLRGMLRPERTCYDVTYYDLNVGVDVDRQFVKGYVDIWFDATEDFSTLQIDLYRNLKINEIAFNEQPLSYKRIFDAVFVYLPEKIMKGTKASIRVVYEGFPTIATNPPWDGGFVFSKDENGNHWAGVACEGEGASLWWPCKDHLSDEPDSASIRIAVPDGLTCVSNGNLRGTRSLGNGFTVFDWFVSYPINTYNVTFNIGKYEHFTDTYTAADGAALSLDYYVLPNHLEKAKTHFEQVKPMLGCYEKFFGKYPFWRDGYCLVESPYLGMEHQSAIAYGNNYNRGYLGGMIPADMNWDYIIIHETAHEYFGNAVSMKDHGDMWIHEAFATYMEALYVECTMSKADAIRYLESQRPYIQNIEPIVGPHNVNYHEYHSSDHYFKGAWMLHTLRNVIDNDEQWFALLRAIYDKFKFTTCTTAELVRFIRQQTGKDLNAFFRQYLTHPGSPKFAYSIKQKGKDLKVRYKWYADEPGFDMPVKVGKPGSYVTLQPVVGEIREIEIPNLKKSEFQVATELFYLRKGGL